MDFVFVASIVLIWTGSRHPVPTRISVPFLALILHASRQFGVSATTNFLSRKNKEENPMKRAMKVALAAAVCLCLTQVSLAQQERQGTRDRRESDDRPTVSDQDFVRMASSDGLAEIDLGRMAMEQATNPEIKRFAQRVIDDHTKANQELNRTANKMGITPATTVD